jgi:hypothetical protein
MKDLDIEELRQLLTFYKQKSSELEFTLLQSELKINKLSAFKTQVEEAQKVKLEQSKPIIGEQPIKIRSTELVSERIPDLNKSSKVEAFNHPKTKEEQDKQSFLGIIKKNKKTKNKKS